MAMGLGFLGRESRASSAVAGILHVAFAALGGAATGALVGYLGSLLDLGSTARIVVIAVAAALALGIALRREPMKLGRPCQVPKQWSSSIPARRLYTVWGLMLGSGVVTLIPYSAHLVLLAGQFVAGPLMGAISGAVYGFTREGLALVGTSGNLEPVPAMDALERWARAARVGNIVAVGAGGAVLVLAA